MPSEYGEPLTERELQIVQLVAEGLTNREVALRLHISHNTIKVHLRNIFTKTGVASRTELSMLAVQEGWVKLPNLPAATEATEGPTELQDEERINLLDTELRGSIRLSRRRRLMLGLGLLLLTFSVALPERNPLPRSASGPGEVFNSKESSALPIMEAPGGQWQELSPLPVRRAGMGAAAFANTIYVVGGMTSQGPSDRLDVYDIEKGAWHTAAPRPIASSNIEAVALADQILVPGGCDESLTPTAEAYLYHAETDTWTAAAPLPTPLCAYALTAIDETAYLFGGWDGERYRALAYAYHLTTDSWETLPAPAQARGFGGAVALTDRVFYVGGYDGQHELDVCEMFLPSTGKWEPCPSMLQPRGGLGLATLGGRIYAIGGGWTTPLGFNERYLPTNQEWSVIETPIAGEWRNMSTVAWGTSIYAIGGWNGTDFLNRTYVIEVMPWRVFIPGTFHAP